MAEWGTPYTRKTSSVNTLIRKNFKLGKTKIVPFWKRSFMDVKQDSSSHDWPTSTYWGWWNCLSNNITFYSSNISVPGGSCPVPALVPARGRRESWRRATRGSPYQSADEIAHHVQTETTTTTTPIRFYPGSRRCNASSLTINQSINQYPYCCSLNYQGN